MTTLHAVARLGLAVLAVLPATSRAESPDGWVATSGACGGIGWDEEGWPRDVGMRTAAECRSLCERTVGCTSFDLSRPRRGRWACSLYAHDAVSGDGADATCFTRAPAYAYDLREGSCRGDGWDRGGWPRSMGYRTARQCERLCDRTEGCTAYDLARPDRDGFDCTLFGHAGVVGEGRDDQCFVRLLAVTPLEGACRGPGWNAGGWPVREGDRTLDEAIAICRETPGCTAFDLARPKGSRADLHLFGHAQVSGKGKDAQCFVVATLRDRGRPGGDPGDAPYPAPPFDPAKVVRAEGPTCPAGHVPVTLGEAEKHRQAVCGKLQRWDIAYLAGGGSMDGPGYLCKTRAREERTLGTALCRPDGRSPPGWGK